MSDRRTSSALMEFASFKRLPFAVAGAAFGGSTALVVVQFAVHFSEAMKTLDANGAPHPIVAMLLIAALEMLIVGLFFIALVSLLVLPVHAVFINWTTATVPIYAAAGLGIGAGIGGLLWLAIASASMSALIEAGFTGGLTGLIATVIFWLIRRPDRAAALKAAVVKSYNPLDYAERLDLHRRAKLPEDYGT